MTQVFSNAFSIKIKPVTSSILPTWVPPTGYFADVPMSNNPADVVPALYAGDSQGADSAFVNWGGSAVLRDFSPLGAQVYYSSGHEPSPDTPNMQFALICDFSTLQWSATNVPNSKNSISTITSIGVFSDGTPYTPHTYLGLQELPAAWGGAKRGSLASFFWAGNNYLNRINLLDVSKSNFGYTQLTTKQSQNVDPTRIRFSKDGADGGSYPITVIDNVRQGWWVATTGSVDYTLFVDKTGAITQFPALGGNLANGTIVLCGKLDLLIAIDGGYSSGNYSGQGYRSLYLRNLTSGITNYNVTLGVVPSLGDGYDGSVGTYNRPDMMGLQWVEELGCIVGIDSTVSPPVIVKLSPPMYNPETNPWTWSKVEVKHWSSDTSGSTALKSARNGMWSKFRWIPSLQSFVYCTAKDGKPQIVRIN
ncbi:hypothetical protein [Massilia sp. PWRC2]|uniref:hypothetical protein n=1 Tax=Massilia sp. PWRC2 TaxID=2804626 RepID=UPI003CECBE9F